MKNKKSYLSFFLMFVLSSGLSIPVWAQDETEGAKPQASNVEQRLNNVEDYLKKFPTTMQQFYNSLQKDLQDYSHSLESGVNEFSQNLQTRVEARLQQINTRKIILDVKTNAYQRLETNSGTFLIAVEKIEPIKDGFKLKLNIGNINYADYNDFTLRLFYGKKWTPKDKNSFAEWHDALHGLEFAMKGKLQKGVWNKVDVDVVPAKKEELEYIELEMDVLAIELQTLPVDKK